MWVDVSKLSCRAPESVDERCGQCNESNVTCSWVFGPRPSGRSPPSPAYVSYLESQVGKLERKLREILPGVNLNRELETLAQVAAPPNLVQPPPIASSSHSTSLPPSPPRAVVDSHGVSAAPQLLKQVRLASESKLQYNQNQLHAPLRKDTYWSETASTRPKEPRYHGQSSGEILLRDAKELKQEYEELSLSAYAERPPTPNRDAPYPSPSSSSHMTNPRSQQPIFARPKLPRARIRQRRPEFWQPTLPEQRVLAKDVCGSGPYSVAEPVVLPPPDLLRSLVDIYFVRVNPFTPVLHRQSFEQELAHLVQDERGYLDSGVDQTPGSGTFARVVLLVCACASRWSSDPRVLSRLADEGDHGMRSLSAGYSFFRQVNLSSRTMYAQAGLWDLQIIILSALYLEGSTASYGAWILVGIGIRLAQDVGAHRRKAENTIENELYKRSFWSLVVMDRLLSGTLGRPSAMQDLDSDLENPIEVDDEHWPIGGQPNQPVGQPCRISYFSCLIGLSRVLGRAQQTVFAIGRTKRQMDLIGPEKEKMLLNDLQYHMKQWQLTVPPHLQLPDPVKFVPSVFLDQAVSLWALYYNTMILIHRPFITIKSSPLTAECLDNCRLYARQCAKILECHLRLPGNSNVILPLTIQPAFSSAMNGDGLDTSESYPMWEKEQDVERCMNTLAHAETKWHDAGRLHDILREFQRSGRILSSDPIAQPEQTEATLGRSAPAWGTTSQLYAQPLAMRSDPTVDRSRSFVSDVTPQYGMGSGYRHPMTPQVRPSLSDYGRMPSDYRTADQFNHATPNQSNPHHLDTRPDSGNFVQSNPADSYHSHCGAYLPDAFYAGDSGVPFPGLMPQLNFSPNRGRGNGSEETISEGGQSADWAAPMQQPIRTSEWEMMANNTMDLGRHAQSH
ncbi:Fungal specific transcription factor domain [Ceratobasidium sp. AG-Ba]|nr:Fungal specific transcription factor domain [Ceratobasidium sp. AG-Ba]